MVMFQLMHSSPLVASQALTQLSSATDLLSFEVVRLSGKNNALECNNMDNQSAEKLDPNTLRRYRDWLATEANPRWGRINRRAEAAFLTGSEEYLTDINKMMRRKNSQSRGTVVRDEPDTTKRDGDQISSNNSAFEVNNTTEFPYLPPPAGDQYVAVGSTQMRSFTGQDDNELLARLEYLSGRNKDLTLSNFRSFFTNVAAIAREDYVLQYQGESSSDNGYSSSSGDNGVVQHDPRYKPHRSKPSTNPVTVAVEQPDDSSGSNEVGKQTKDPTVRFARMFKTAQEDIGEELGIGDGIETERHLLQKEQQFYKEPLRPSYNNHVITKVSAVLFGQFFDQASQHDSGPSRYQKEGVEMEVEMEPLDEFEVPHLDLGGDNLDPDPSMAEDGLHGLNTASAPTDRTERRMDPNTPTGAAAFPDQIEGLPFDRLSQKTMQVGFAAGRNKF